MAKGLTVSEITENYLEMGSEVFKRNWFRRGIIRARYDEVKLIAQLKRVLGPKTTLGDRSVGTGLLVVTKGLVEENKVASGGGAS